MFNLIPWKKKESIGTALQPRRDRDPFSLIRSEFDQLFDRFYQDFFAPLSTPGGFPRLWELDWEDTDKEVIVRAEAPGFEVGDFDVQVSGNWLTIRAERKQTKKNGNGQKTAERLFQRSLTLPPGVDPDKVEARYHSGVLELHFAKLPEAMGKRITVKSE
jgi:HSP20 family protein